MAKHNPPFFQQPDNNQTSEEEINMFNISIPLDKFIGLKRFYINPEHKKIHIWDSFPEPLIGYYSPYFNPNDLVFNLWKTKCKDNIHKKSLLKLSGKDFDNFNPKNGSFTDKATINCISFFDIKEPSLFEGEIKFNANYGIGFAIYFTKPIPFKKEEKALKEVCDQISMKINNDIIDLNNPVKR